MAGCAHRVEVRWSLGWRDALTATYAPMEWPIKTIRSKPICWRHASMALTKKDSAYVHMRIGVSDEGSSSLACAVDGPGWGALSEGGGASWVR